MDAPKEDIENKIIDLLKKSDKESALSICYLLEEKKLNMKYWDVYSALQQMANKGILNRDGDGPGQPVYFIK